MMEGATFHFLALCGYLIVDATLTLHLLNSLSIYRSVLLQVSSKPDHRSHLSKSQHHIATILAASGIFAVNDTQESEPTPLCV